MVSHILQEKQEQKRRNKQSKRRRMAMCDRSVIPFQVSPEAQKEFEESLEEMRVMTIHHKTMDQLRYLARVSCEEIKEGTGNKTSFEDIPYAFVRHMISWVNNNA